jgi:beta-galactosidase
MLGAAELGGGDVVMLGAAELGGGDVVTPGAAELGGGDVVTLGAAQFDARTGMLRELGGLELDGPRLDLWRAPIDNDRPLVGGWRRAGLDRMHHKVLGVQADGAGLSVRTRVGAAGTGLGMDVVYQWRPEGDQVWLTVAVTPLGSWDVPLPRLGVALNLAGQEAELEWFGLGPGEAYRDSDSAVRVGRYRRTLAELQTPYVRPQENGNRRAVRWARLTRSDGAVLSISGDPVVDVTARPWSTAALAAARHTCDLKPDGRIHLHVDAAQHGLGSASCGPPVPAWHTLAAIPASFTIGLAAEGPDAGTTFRSVSSYE